MRNETTVVRSPKAWVILLLGLGHAVIIVALALSAQRGPEPGRVLQGPSILESLSESPAPLR